MTLENPKTIDKCWLSLVFRKEGKEEKEAFSHYARLGITHTRVEFYPNA